MFGDSLIKLVVRILSLEFSSRLSWAALAFEMESSSLVDVLDNFYGNFEHTCKGLCCLDGSAKRRA